MILLLVRLLLLAVQLFSHGIPATRTNCSSSSFLCCPSLSLSGEDSLEVSRTPSSSLLKDIAVLYRTSSAPSEALNLHNPRASVLCQAKQTYVAGVSYNNQHPNLVLLSGVHHVVIT